MASETSESARRVCTVDDVTPDSPYVGDSGGTEVAIFTVDGDYYALDPTCPHQGGPLEQGRVADGCVHCPWHGWQFDLETGEHAQNVESATAYEVWVDGDDVYVEV